MAIRKSYSTRSRVTTSSCLANSSRRSSQTCARKCAEMIRPKKPPVRLDILAYEILRQQILQRDGWRCQSCGAMVNLEVHHREFRSRSGEDSEGNLITMCAECHAILHTQEACKSHSPGRGRRSARLPSNEGID